MCASLNYSSHSSLHCSWLNHTPQDWAEGFTQLLPVKEGNPIQTQVVRSTVKSITQKTSGETTTSEYRVPQSGPWEGCDLCYSVPGMTTRLLHHPTSAHCLLLEHAWFLVEVPDGLTQVRCLPGRLEREQLSFCGGRWGWFTVVLNWN